MRKELIKLTALMGWTLIFSGCALITHREQITALKSLGNEQRQLEKYVNQQEELFLKLKSDIQNQRLAKGMPKAEALLIYGEPLYCKSADDKGVLQEACLYRHPTWFFSSDMISLEFDHNQGLCSWELRPAYSF
ncbi:MAG: hypothetical protein ABIG31_02730 [Candidatus Omnitrophota bacterium]